MTHSQKNIISLHSSSKKMLLLLFTIFVSSELTQSVALKLESLLRITQNIITQNARFQDFYPGITQYAEFLQKHPLDIMEQLGFDRSTIESVATILASLNSDQTLENVAISVMNLMGIEMTTDSFNMVMPTVIDTIRENDNFYKFMNFNKTIAYYILYDFSTNVETYTLGNMTSFLRIDLTSLYTNCNRIGNVLLNQNANLYEFMVALGYPDPQGLLHSIQYLNTILTEPLTLEDLSKWQIEIQTLIDNCSVTFLQLFYSLVNDLLKILKPSFLVSEASYRERLDAFNSFLEDVLYNIDFTFLQIFLEPETLLKLQEFVQNSQNSFPLYSLFQDKTMFAALATLLQAQTPLDLGILRIIPNGENIIELLSLLSNKETPVMNSLEVIGRILGIADIVDLVNLSFYSILEENEPLKNIPFLHFISGYDENLVSSILTLIQQLALALTDPLNMNKPIGEILSPFDSAFEQLGLSYEMIYNLSVELTLLNERPDVVTAIDLLYSTQIKEFSLNISLAISDFLSDANKYHFVISKHIDNYITNIVKLANQPENKVGDLINLILLEDVGTQVWGCALDVLEGIAKNSTLYQMAQSNEYLKLFSTLTNIANWSPASNVSFKALMDSFVFQSQLEPNAQSMPLHFIYNTVYNANILIENDQFLLPIFYDQFLQLESDSVFQQVVNLQNRILTSNSLSQTATTLLNSDQSSLFNLISSICLSTYQDTPISISSITTLSTLITNGVPDIIPADIPEIPTEAPQLSSDDSLTSGVIAGIVVSCIVVAVIIIVIIATTCKKKNAHQEFPEESNSYSI